MIEPDFSAFGTPLLRATYLNSNSVNSNINITNILLIIAATATVALIVYSIVKINEKPVNLKKDTN
jgi:hypothetical protein